MPHAPFRENEPSRSRQTTTGRGRAHAAETAFPSSSLCPGVIWHTWVPVYGREEPDQSVEGFNRAEGITQERGRPSRAARQVAGRRLRYLACESGERRLDLRQGLIA